MAGRKGYAQLAVHVPDELAAKLKELSERTRVPQAAYLREALEDLLKKYENRAKGARS